MVWADFLRLSTINKAWMNAWTLPNGQYWRKIWAQLPSNNELSKYSHLRIAQISYHWKSTSQPTAQYNIILRPDKMHFLPNFYSFQGGLKAAKPSHDDTCHLPRRLGCLRRLSGIFGWVRWLSGPLGLLLIGVSEAPVRPPPVAPPRAANETWWPSII